MEISNKLTRKLGMNKLSLRICTFLIFSTKLSVISFAAAVLYVHGPNRINSWWIILVKTWLL